MGVVDRAVANWHAASYSGSGNWLDDIGGTLNIGTARIVQQAPLIANAFGGPQLWPLKTTSTALQPTGPVNFKILCDFDILPATYTAEVLERPQSFAFWFTNTSISAQKYSTTTSQVTRTITPVSGWPPTGLKWVMWFFDADFCRAYIADDDNGTPVTPWTLLGTETALAGTPYNSSFSIALCAILAVSGSNSPVMKELIVENNSDNSKILHLKGTDFIEKVVPTKITATVGGTVESNQALSSSTNIGYTGGAEAMRFSNTSSNALINLAGLVTGLECSVGVIKRFQWYRTTLDTSKRTIARMGDNGGATRDLCFQYSTDTIFLQDGFTVLDSHVGIPYAADTSFVFVNDPATGLHVYMDGVLILTDASFLSTTRITTAYPATASPPAQDLSGQISDFIVWNEVLGATDAGAIYDELYGAGGDGDTYVPPVREMDVEDLYARAMETDSMQVGDQRKDWP